MEFCHERKSLEREYEDSPKDKLMPLTKPLFDGLKETFEWYKNNMDSVIKKPFFEYIDKML